MNELATIADDINKEHSLAVSSARTAIEHAHKAGELLSEAKQQVKHGQWGQWMKDNLPFSERTAQAYMRVSKTQLSADLTIQDALESMAAPKKEPEPFNLNNQVACIYPDMPAGKRFTRMIAEHPEHKGYYLYTSIEQLEGEEDAGMICDTSKKPIHGSAMHYILESWGIKSLDEFTMIPADEIEDIYSFMWMPEPKPKTSKVRGFSEKFRMIENLAEETGMYTNGEYTPGNMPKIEGMTQDELILHLMQLKIIATA